jgi:hypothetical protein
MRHLDSSLARWAFPAVGAFALTPGLLLPALLCGIVTAAAWKIHRPKPWKVYRPKRRRQ